MKHQVLPPSINSLLFLERQASCISTAATACLGISTTRLAPLTLTGKEEGLTSSLFWKLFRARISLCERTAPRASLASAPPANRMRAVTAESNDGLVSVSVKRFSRIDAEP